MLESLIHETMSTGPGLERLVNRVRRALPEGQSLPHDVWQRRHQAIVVLLWLHAVGIPCFGVIAGQDLAHSLSEGAVVGLTALLAGFGERSAVFGKRSRTFRAGMASFGLITSSAVLVHLSGGYVEMHFHFFVMVAVISLYQQWAPFLLAIAYVVVHHGLIGTVFPEAVYNHPDAWAHPWKWALIHGTFVLAASSAAIVNWRLSEAARARSELILNSVGEGICGVDVHGRATFVNPAAASMTGYAVEELVGQRVHDVPRRSDRRGASRPDDEGLIHLAPGDGTARGMTEGVVRRKDGSSFPVESVRTPIRERHELVGEVVSFRDITERERAEKKIHALNEELEERVVQRTEQLQEAIENLERQIAERERAEEALFRLAAIVESSDDAIIGKTLDTVVTSWNAGAEELYGYAAPEVIGQPISILVPPDRVDELPGLMERVKRGERITHYETVRMRKDGRQIDVSVSLSPIESSDGHIVGIATIARDVTERKRVQRELKRAYDAALEASRAKSEFLANMSHEIRTPMNAILGMADLLAESPLSPEQEEYVRISRGAGDTLLRVIDDILDLSKVEAGQIEIERVEFDLVGLVDRTAEVLAPRAHSKGLELLSQLEPDVPTRVVGDPGRLGQVLTNLVGNAVKFTEQGEVSLRVEREPGAAEPAVLRFTVRDTGIGIPSEKLDAIFDTFTQVDASITRRYGGSGLGLTISKRLVELMGGRIRVESVVGGGSAFSFTVPLEVRAGPDLGAAPPPVDLEGWKILVVDDNATNRMILRETLARHGALVTEAESGALGLAELHRARQVADPYRLMLLDGCMPEMNGFQVAEQIGKEAGTLDAAIIMLTSDRRGGDIARVRALGLAGYLVKPVKLAELLETIAVAVHRRTPAQAATVEAVPVPVGAALSDGCGPRILLVEDSEDNRALIQFYLKGQPYQLDIAENGKVGVAKLMAGEYDLVLMDVQMPVMDGYTATRAIRAWEGEHGRSPTPIVALTANALVEHAQRSLEVGCTAHLAKPVKKAALLRAIAEHSRSVMA